jgi:hypothetical protein
MPGTLTSKDFWGGLMLIAVGVAAVLIARGYPFGTALRMGPGYFPTILGGVLTLFGLYLVAKALRHSEAIEGGWSLRAMIVLPLSLILFGILMDRAGFIPALVVLIFGSALASSEFKLVEVAALTVLLIVFCVAVFIWGLGLPYPLLADF